LRRTREPVGEQVTATERSVSKSAVSRAFVSKPGENLAALMSRGLADVRLAVLMIDGIDLKGTTNVVARGLDVEQGVLCVLDGSKALRKAVRDVLGIHTPVQRCVRHKERNVRDHL